MAKVYQIGELAQLSGVQDEIRGLLRAKDNSESNCGEVNAALDQHIAHVAERLAKLRKLRLSS